MELVQQPGEVGTVITPVLQGERLKLRKARDLPKATWLVRSRVRILTRQASYRAFTSQRRQPQSVAWEGLPRAPSDAVWGAVSCRFYCTGEATLQSLREVPC